LLICRLAGGGEIAIGKLTLPDAKILPMPVDLSKKETLNYWLVVNVFAFLSLKNDILKKSSLPV
jgi:hypothetical protein